MHIARILFEKSFGSLHSAHLKSNILTNTGTHPTADNLSNVTHNHQTILKNCTYAPDSDEKMQIKSFASMALMTFVNEGEECFGV